MTQSKKNPGKGRNRTFAAKRTMNPPLGSAQPTHTERTKGFQEQDVKHRLGNFEGAGEHARTGRRGQ